MNHTLRLTHILRRRSLYPSSSPSPPFSSAAGAVFKSSACLLTNFINTIASEPSKMQSVNVAGVYVVQYKIKTGFEDRRGPT